MNDQTLWVPFSVLNDTGLSTNTRLIWTLLCLHPGVTDTRLGTLSGLDPRTIALARARLVQAPPAPCSAKPQRACAEMPAALLTDPCLSAGARLLYGQIQGAGGGSFTYAALSRLTGSSDDTLRRAAAELAAAGWLAVTRTSRKSPLCFKLRNPVETRLLARINAIRRRIKRAPHRGEALLREFLNARVAEHNYEDNATPDFLVNPYTRELMELDRYYPDSKVALEFNGDQHFEVTDLSTLEPTVKQVGRDAMKAFLCKIYGIELVIIRPEDLSSKALDKKIPSRLPRRDPTGLEPALDALAAEYRERSAEERARKSSV